MAGKAQRQDLYALLQQLGNLDDIQGGASQKLRDLFGDRAQISAIENFAYGGDQQLITAGDGSNGYRVRIGDVGAMYGADGSLQKIHRVEDDSFGMKFMRAAMPAAALAVMGGAAFAPEMLGGAQAATAAGASPASAGATVTPLGAAPGSSAVYVTPLGAAPSAVATPLAAPAAVAPAIAPQTAAAPSLASRVLNAGRSVVDAVQPYASLVGPAMSLLGGAQQVGSLPQQPADAPRLPGVEAPPEARGLQAARNPILDVLGRNRSANKSRTQLTGNKGVNMSSTRVGGTTLLGL